MRVSGPPRLLQAHDSNHCGRTYRFRLAGLENRCLNHELVLTTTLLLFVMIVRTPNTAEPQPDGGPAVRQRRVAVVGVGNGAAAAEVVLQPSDVRSLVSRATRGLRSTCLPMTVSGMCRCCLGCVACHASAGLT